MALAQKRNRSRCVKCISVIQETRSRQEERWSFSPPVEHYSIIGKKKPFERKIRETDEFQAKSLGVVVNTVSVSCYVRQHRGNPDSQWERDWIIDWWICVTVREKKGNEREKVILPEGISFHLPLLIKLPSVYTNISHIIMTRLNPFPLVAFLARCSFCLGLSLHENT